MFIYLLASSAIFNPFLPHVFTDSLHIFFPDSHHIFSYVLSLEKKYMYLWLTPEEKANSFLYFSMN